MHALRVSRHAAQRWWLAVGVVGFLIAFDSLLFVLALLAVIVTGSDLNPYSGIVVFVLSPLGLVAGCALCWLSYEMIWEHRAEAAGEAVGLAKP